MSPTRRGLLAAAALLPAPARAQAWPTRPVRLVVGFTPGSSTDVTARIFAQAFSQAWGQPVVVENIPGQGGAIGADRVAKSPPDGATLLWGANGALTIVPTLQPVGFDPLKDLAAIGRTLSMASVFLVANGSPFHSLGDVIAAARVRPGGLAYGTPGVGTPQHIAVEMLCRLAGIRMEHVPYRGANLADVMNGVLPLGVQNSGVAMPLAQEGRIRAIAVSSLQRSPAMPEIPTVAEQGFPGFEALSWFGLMAPAGTPRPILDKVHAEAMRVLADAEQRARFAQLGLDPAPSTGEEMQALIAADIQKWARVIAEAGIQAGR
ncbi:Bug family tripartite tricarboxylate transporter substrate binding protein [Paracraurococcus lichenis]|uniref:Tripartite tricarboxylate transporter substrate binding protein n=1 Tax=Paracraurococcus lichenis TaxID=3064888 RepID=A0ABT9DZS1_9PROT|nr:tripartite tricarboxylate transporter substrate binding protein [Paracraurococcus sp. LOR1-02]MDO9709406.1 tripartite tricarboxylate transporter substrate binding protein [Paracraurococcus sp. LOR1-02]